MAYSRGVSLTQIHPSPDADADTDIDIIAIHGLDTKSPDTWISKSCYPDEHVNWLACPPDLLEQPDLIQKTADEFARLLLAGIKRRPLPTKTGSAKRKDRPIVFIASCLGGIILIKALVIAGHSSSEYTAVRRSTRGIVFLATPFRGTSFQDVANWAEPGLRAWASIRGQKVSNLLDDVKASSFHLEELVRKFTQLCQDKYYPYQVFTFYETGLTSLHRKFPLSWLIPAGALNLAVPPKPVSTMEFSAI
ncbi:protein SERAC1 [Trichoderma asperellum]|uniref:Protein SERAC1 n=1 Tax=Trichoderma asperellum TaxID=101201 RepID=A0A6V8R155_TRIAP|nr:protein SERAC1 [Trichoderma asperellum]